MKSENKNLELTDKEIELLLECVQQGIELLKRHGWEAEELKLMEDKLLNLFENKSTLEPV